MQLTKNFHIDEFKCKDGTEVPDEYISNVQELANNLQILRDYINSQDKSHPEWIISIMSGYRTKEHNKKVGGANNSQHKLAKAGDIKIYYKWGSEKIYMPPSEVAVTIETLIATGKMKKGGVGRYETFTHYDVRGNNARW